MFMSWDCARPNRAEERTARGICGLVFLLKGSQEWLRVKCRGNTPWFSAVRRSLWVSG